MHKDQILNFSNVTYINNNGGEGYTEEWRMYKAEREGRMYKAEREDPSQIVSYEYREESEKTKRLKGGIHLSMVIQSSLC